MKAPHKIAPTAVYPLDGHGSASGIATAAGAGSAHTNPDLEAAVARVVRHGRRDAIVAAKGDRKRAKALMLRQGEVLMLAGLHLVGEGQ